MKHIVKINVSVFWKYFIMMVCILLTTMAAGILTYRITLETLTEENLSRMKTTLEYNAQRMADDFGKTISLPEAVERSHYYSYLRPDSNGILKPEDYAVLALIRQDMIQITSVTLDYTEEYLLYLPSLNSICTQNHCFPVAENCFENYLLFSETSTEELLELLTDSKRLQFLPVQNIHKKPIGQQTATVLRCLPVISHTPNHSTSFMVLYTEEYLLNQLGIHSLPEDTFLQMKTSDGTILEAYPRQLPEEEKNDYYEFTSTLNTIGVHVTVWIPKTYFSQLLSKTRSAYMGCYGLAFLVGLGLSFLFSKLSISPLRLLLNKHGGREQTILKNEIHNLDALINRSIFQSKTLQKQLVYSLLLKIFYGIPASVEEQQHLKEYFSDLSTYYVVIAHANGLQEDIYSCFNGLDAEKYIIPLTKTEFGMIVSVGDQLPEQLLHCIREYHSQIAKTGIFLQCGVSQPMEQHSQLSEAVYQARRAIPTHMGIRSYSPDTMDEQPRNWLQHEEFYQHILQGDRQEAFAILESIAKPLSPVNAAPLFYNTLFTIQSAIAAINLPEAGIVYPELNVSLSALENFDKLFKLLDLVFQHMEEMRSHKDSDLATIVLAWLKANYTHDDACLTALADDFGISKKQANIIIEKATGMTFHQYLLKLRMEKAAYLLTTSEETVMEIAEHCGYLAESTFFRVFKKYYGMTPSKFRLEKPSNHPI